jgi:hypothetical protein
MLQNVFDPFYNLSIKNRMGITELKEDLATFTKKAKEAVQSSSNDVDALKQIQQLWKKQFHGSLDATSAKGFVAHFKQGKKGTRKNRNQKGGSAPIAYQMGPGVPSAMTYGHFPTDVSTDKPSQHDLDVYFNSGMSRTAGTESWRFPTVPPGMGSNKVGGGRRSTRRNRKQKGGASLLQTIGQIPFQAAVPPSVIQTAYGAYSGQTPAPSSDPTAPAWSLTQSKSVIDPANITKIGSDINQLVTPTPWK